MKKYFMENPDAVFSLLLEHPEASQWAFEEVLVLITEEEV